MLNSDPNKPETKQMKLMIFITEFSNTPMLHFVERKTGTKILLNAHQTKISQTNSWVILRITQKRKENNYWNKCEPEKNQLQNIKTFLHFPIAAIAANSLDALEY